MNKFSVINTIFSKEFTCLQNALTPKKHKGSATQ